MRRIIVASALAFRFFPSTGSNSAIRTIFCPVGFRQIGRSAEGAFLHISPVKQGGAQASVQRQDGSAEPAAHKRVCDTLRADTFFAVVQKQAEAAVIVTATMYQPAGRPVLLIVHVDNHGSFSTMGSLT